MTTECPWSPGQVRTFVKDAIESSVGKKGWSFLGREIQEAVIKAKVTDVLCGQDESNALDSTKIMSLVNAMLTEAGLAE